MSVNTYEPEPQLAAFSDLVRMSEMDGPGTRLLVVLVKVQRHQHKGDDGDYHLSDNEGTLTPLMVRDFPLTRDTQLKDIVAEADDVSTDWEFLMTVVLPGRNGEPAEEDEIEGHLTRMAQTLTTAENLGQFAFFTREGDPIQLESTVEP